MASTRESSPASAASPQLTPNSKIKAMLAAFDEDSDDESVSGSARARAICSFTKTKTKPKPSTPSTNETANEREKANDGKREGSGTASEDGYDEDQVAKPRRRLVAAMLAQNNGSEEETASADDARQRVKKMLMARSKSPEQSPNTENSGSEESDVLVVSRKHKIRLSRHGTPESTPERAPASPGLFVSPNAQISANLSGDVSDSDELPENPGKNDRFNALVEKKRQEILAREKEAREKKAKKAAERRRHADVLEEDGDMDGSDDNDGRRLTQQVRPTRKASKRALEEMHKETQRLSRNQQLAHNATTKKKFTKADFMARFKFRTGSEDLVEQSARPTSSSSAAHSDLEMKDTPPTSPISHGDDHGKSVVASTLPAPPEQEEDDEELPTLKEALAQVPSSPPTRLDKGKGKATEEKASESEKPKGPVFKQRPIRIRPPKMVDRKSSPLNDSDSDLEIVSAKAPLKKIVDSIFDRVPAKQAKESHSLHALRMLAHLPSPGKQNIGKDKKPSMTASELQVSLQQRARQQATREREERLQALRDRGVIVQTTEERQQQMVEVEDLISKARREGEEIMRREKAAAKKERKDRGEVDPLGDSSDDEDWVENKENIPEEHSASGSDEDEEGSRSEGNDSSGEEDEDEMESDGEEDMEPAANPIFDNEAAESDEGETEVQANLSIDEDMADDGDCDDEEDDLPVKQKGRRARNANFISDDEDTESNDDQRSPSVPKMISPAQANMDSPIAPNSVLRSATKTFIPGLTVTGPVGLGLTQIFAGTMDDSQSAGSSGDQDSQSQQIDPEHDSMAYLRRLPAPELPPFIPTMEEDTQEVVTNSQSQISYIPESQPVGSETQEIELNFSQSQVHGFDSLVEESQMSPFPEATQDDGFQHMTPIKGRFVDAPPSTVDTLVMDPRAVPETTEETPIVKRKGKLRRRAPAVAFSDDEEDIAELVNIGEDDFEIDENVFDVMRKASEKKKVVAEDFDKKNSKAKEMVNEQADESEDEYAGLGGASDDESGGEADEYVKALIDDEGGKEIDESKLAAFFADRERANDEKQVEQLYKDITNGMLRRKRGADYDLSDSDDGGEARRRMKRKEFAKMRKALLADERIGKIAENPKRQAFLRAIEDRGSEDEMDFLDDFPEQEEGESQSQSQAEGSQQVLPSSHLNDMGPPKRKRSDDMQENDERLPPHLRRTKPAKKPTNLSEIRESLSSLIEQPNAMIAAADPGSESEDGLEIEEDDDLGPRKEKDKENRDPFALRRTQHVVIDRISLKRVTSNTGSSSTRLAFAASSTVSGFKVPALLRRATTNSSLTSSTSSSVSGGMSITERMAGASGIDGVKRGGGKNSGVNYFARESERRAAVVKTEKMREQKRFKGAEVRRKVIGGLFGGGKFE